MTCSDSTFTISEDWDTEDMCQAEREWGMERESTGIAKGMKKGESRMAKLMNILFAESRFEDAKRATEDKEYRDRLLREFKLDC